MTPLTARLRFFGKFVVAAAALFLLWKAGGAAAYGYAVLVVVTVVSPILTGYQVVMSSAGAHGLTAFFERGTARIEVPFVLHEALAGVIPFIALMCASAGQTLRQFATRTAIGVGVLYAAHVAVLTAAPLLVTDHERWITRVIDVVYGFYAVAGFVGLPFSLWMILTRPWEGGLIAPIPVPSPQTTPTAVRKANPAKPKR